MTSTREKRKSEKRKWFLKFQEKIKSHHPRSTEKVAEKILKRCDSSKNSMVVRSNKMGVPCTVTADELRQLVYEHYGAPCKYCGRTLILSVMAFDHVVPMSKGGDSTIANLQVICRTSNNMKGSLTEENFLILLSWLQTVSEELRKDVSIRLARGIH